MNIWILTIWVDGGAMNEVAAVIFDEAAVMPKVRELLGEVEGIIQVTVETWHKDAHDDPDASYYESETFWQGEEE